MAFENHGIDAFLDDLAQEVLRWNRQINLISRREPEDLIAQLAADSLTAAKRLPDALAGWDPEVAEVLRGKPGVGGEAPQYDLVYIDIGSGAGFPGLVWHVWWRRNRESGVAGPAGDAHAPFTYLVEPRAKRAWFLERMAGRPGFDGAVVVAARWGESKLPRQEPSQCRSANTLWILSLRAIRLDDAAVLEGWRLAIGKPALPEGDRLVVARFQPPGARLTSDLRDELRLPEIAPDSGGEIAGASSISLMDGRRAEQGGGPSLLLSCYRGRSAG